MERNVKNKPLRLQLMYTERLTPLNKHPAWCELCFLFFNYFICSGLAVVCDAAFKENHRGRKPSADVNLL